ncbi:MAG: hypothetical protein OSB34_17240 [Planktomarina sp.]|nr:hypothetical protein [Planktomarina sp.]
MIRSGSAIIRSASASALPKAAAHASNRCVFQASRFASVILCDLSGFIQAVYSNTEVAQAVPLPVAARVMWIW